MAISTDTNGITIKLPLHRKVAAGGAGGGLAVLLVYLGTLAHVNLSPEAAGGLVAALSLLGGYLTPLKKVAPRADTVIDAVATVADEAAAAVAKAPAAK